MKKITITIILLILLLASVAIAPTFENFSTYTEEDPHSAMTLPDNYTISWTHLSYDSSESYFQKNSFTFNGDFIHEFQINFSDISEMLGDLPMFLVWMLSDMSGGFEAIYSEDMVYLDALYYDDYYGEGHTIMFALGGDVSILTGGHIHGVSFPLTYYVCIERDESVGVNGTYYVRICTDSRWSECGTVAIEFNVAASAKKDYTYITLPNTSWFNPFESDGSIEDLDLNASERNCDFIPQITIF